MSTFTEPCDNYAGKNACRLSTNGNCYTPGPCAYTIPGTVTDKLTWCNNMSDDSATPKKCTYVASAATCSPINSCEAILAPTSAAYCNAYLDKTNC